MRHGNHLSAFLLAASSALVGAPLAHAQAVVDDPSACASVTLPTGPTFNYRAVGTAFLSKLQNDFWNPTTQTFHDSISCGSGAHGPVAFMWTEDYAIRALYWGARVDPATFLPHLNQTVDGTRAYAETFTDSRGTWTAYAVTPNAHQIDFDDNGLFGGTLIDVFFGALANFSVLSKGANALGFDYGHRQAGLGNGEPQVYADPLPVSEVGDFYTAPSLSVARSFTKFGSAIHDPALIDIGDGYFNEIISPSLGLLKSNGLYIGNTQYDPATGLWTPTKTGELAAQSTEIAGLALALYQARGDATKLRFAENLMTKVLAEWYRPGTGVNQISVFGGYAIVDELCALYSVDHDQTWFEAAKSIVDFLLADGRDEAGYFADGTTATGKWNIVRTGEAPDATVTLLTQMAAAAAILEFASINETKGSVAQ